MPHKKELTFADCALRFAGIDNKGRMLKNELGSCQDDRPVPWVWASMSPDRCPAGMPAAACACFVPKPEDE